MKILNVRNVHEALPEAIDTLILNGNKRDSRNGPVYIYPFPVTTVYSNPCERVLFHPERDANPAFHLYESLWMLAGRNDIEPILRYTKNFAKYSDDGVTMHDAYGYRWRKHFGDKYLSNDQFMLDQLKVIAESLQKNKDDRRCVLEMWDAEVDLGRQGKAFPCNLIATFQISLEGKLDLVVFCRSNDIIYGCYGANAVHMSFLLEYMAYWIGVPVGTYTQISVNWHMYQDIYDNVLPDLQNLRKNNNYNPYRDDEVINLPMTTALIGESAESRIQRLDQYIQKLLYHADTEFKFPFSEIEGERWVNSVYAVLKAHNIWRTFEAPDRFEKALEVLNLYNPKIDWIRAMKEWIERRQLIWQSKQ